MNYFNGYPTQLDIAVSLLKATRIALYNPEDTSENEPEIRAITKFITRLQKQGWIT